jgi:P27 family predicted phage terminase small subunit
VATRGRKALNASQVRPKATIGGLWEGFTQPQNLTEAASAEFNRLVANLRRAGTLERTDPKVVLNAARVQALLDDALEALAAEGLDAESSNHTPMAHPLVNVANTLLMRIAKLQGEMGLTPATSKYGSAPADEKDEDGWGDLLTVTG